MPIGPTLTRSPNIGRNATVETSNKQNEPSNGATSSTAAEATPNTPPRQAISAPGGGAGAHNLRRLVNKVNDKIKEIKFARLLRANMEGCIGLHEKALNIKREEVGNNEEAAKELKKHEDEIKDLKNSLDTLCPKDEYEKDIAEVVNPKINEEKNVMSGGDLRRNSARAAKNINSDKESKGKGVAEGHSNLHKDIPSTSGSDKTEEAGKVEIPSTSKKEVETESDDENAVKTESANVHKGIPPTSGSDKTEEAGKVEIPSTPKKEVESKSDDDKKEDGINKFSNHPGFERIQKVIREEVSKAEGKHGKMALQAAALEELEMENSLSSMRMKLYMHMLERISRSIDALHKIG